MKINHKILFNASIITLGFITLLNFSQYYLNNKIINSEQEYYNQQLSDLIKNIKYNNIILNSKIIINNKNYLNMLGKKAPTELYLAKYNNISTAIIVNSSAPDGYNGTIDLLIAIALNPNKIANIKVLNHKETPGLGDLIETEKSNYLTQFTNKNINNVDNIDSITGATITSHAVNNAVKNSLLLINNHPEIIYNK